MSDYVISVIRTVVPVVVGWVATWLLSVGVEIDSVAFAAFLTSVLSGLYYVTVRFLEERFPWARWFLGVPSVPGYSASNDS